LLQLSELSVTAEITVSTDASALSESGGTEPEASQT
jgi:hypothetical protein